METDETVEKSEPFDLFELVTAILLGLAAVGAAIAGLQSGQWGGKQLEAFSEANRMTTKAATTYNEASVLINADYAAVATAKEHILEARDAPDPATKKRHFDLASYYYSTQLTEQAYAAMELPAGFFVEDEEEQPAGAQPAQPAPATPAEGGAEEAEGASSEGAASAPEIERDIPDAELLETLSTELDDDYSDKMLAEATKGFADADKKFNEGRVANENGDQFELVGVFFSVALFFGGVGLVFKTSMRWAFFGLAAIVFLGSAVYMFMLPWAG